MIRRCAIWILALGCPLIIGCGDSNGPAELEIHYVIIDDDNGMAYDRVRQEGSYIQPLARFTDPDGGLQLLYALGDPTVELLGLTCMMGTVTTDTCMEANRALLELVGRTDIPVLRGATDATQLGEETDAARFIVDTVNQRPGEVEIVASGPLTNIATALMLDPDLPQVWKTLYILSGEFGRGSNIEQTEALTGGDLNLSVDNPAAEYVFAHAGQCKVFPNSLMDDVLIDGADMEFLRQAQTPLSSYVLYETENWFYAITTVFDLEGFWPHGMTGLAAALDPRHRGPATRSAVSVRSTGEPRGVYYWGPTVTDLVDDPDRPVHEVYFRFLDTARFRRDYLQRLSQPPESRAGPTRGASPPTARKCTRFK